MAWCRPELRRGTVCVAQWDADAFRAYRKYLVEHLLSENGGLSAQRFKTILEAILEYRLGPLQADKIPVYRVPAPLWHAELVSWVELAKELDSPYRDILESVIEAGQWVKKTKTYVTHLSKTISTRPRQLERFLDDFRQYESHAAEALSGDGLFAKLAEGLRANQSAHELYVFQHTKGLSVTLEPLSSHR